MRGLDIDDATLETLLSIDPVAWRQEMEAIGKYLDEFGTRVPARCAKNSAQSRRSSDEADSGCRTSGYVGRIMRQFH